MKQSFSKKRAVVVIPIYKIELTRQEEYSIQRTLEVLSDWTVMFIAPKRLQSMTGKIDDNFLDTLKYVYFDDRFFNSVTGYSKLLMSRFFYEMFSHYEFMLLVQTDALVISDQLEYWCSQNYSFIGAPWFAGMDKPSEPLKMSGVGNGGFSLRKIEDFIKVLSVRMHTPIKTSSCSNKGIMRFLKILKNNYIYAYNFPPFLPKINEDIFWGKVIPQVAPNFSVPNVEDAARFSFEVCPEYLYEVTGRELPFGCHAWEKYNKTFWNKKLKIPHEVR